MTEQTVPLSGIQYHTLLQHPPSPTPSKGTILLIHALMSNSQMWDSTVTTLHSQGYSTLRIDHIGHNLTPPPPSPPTPSLTMDDLTSHLHSITTKVLSTPGSPPLKGVIGCSIGGVLSLRYAMLYPSPSLTHVISVTAPGISAPEKLDQLWLERIALFEQDVRNGTQELCNKTVERWFPGARPEDDATRAESLRHVKTCSIEGYKVLVGAIRGYDYRGEEARLKGVKVCVVAGEEDLASSVENLRGLAEKIEGAEFVVVKGAGHLPPMQKEEEFGEVVKEFLQG